MLLLTLSNCKIGTDNFVTLASWAALQRWGVNLGMDTRVTVTTFALSTRTYFFQYDYIPLLSVRLSDVERFKSSLLTNGWVKNTADVRMRELYPVRKLWCLGKPKRKMASCISFDWKAPMVRLKSSKNATSKRSAHSHIKFTNLPTSAYWPRRAPRGWRHPCLHDLSLNNGLIRICVCLLSATCPTFSSAGWDVLRLLAEDWNDVDNMLHDSNNIFCEDYKVAQMCKVVSNANTKCVLHGYVFGTGRTRKGWRLYVCLETWLIRRRVLALHLSVVSLLSLLPLDGRLLT